MTRCTGRDNDRQQVYAAEDLSAELTILVDLYPTASLQRIADQLCSTAWWLENFDPTPIQIVRNRSGRQSSFAPGTRTVSLSPHAHDLNTLCHEIAHAATADRGDEGPVHGARFRAIHIQVRAAVCGPVAAADLLEVYRQFGLGVAAVADLRSFDEPPVLGNDAYESERIVGRPQPPARARSSKGPIAL